MTPEAFSVTAAVDSHVAATETPRPPDGRWHPSSLYGCQRKAVYEVRGVPETDPRDARSRRVLRVGHILHEFVQDAVTGQASVARSFREVPVEIPELNIVGTGDQLVEFASGFMELQEYKSISSRGFKYGDLPKPEHVGQVTPYMRALRDYGSPAMGIPPLRDRLSRARITYVSKDDLEIDESTVLWTEAKNADLETRVQKLNPYREGVALPTRQPRDKKGQIPNYPCGYCAFVTRCWGQDGENEQKGGAGSDTAEAAAPIM